MSLCLAAQSLPAETPPAYDFDVRARALPRAVERLAEQAGLQVAYDSAAFAGHEAAAVVGTMPLDTALDKLLAGTSATWHLIDERTLVLRVPADDAAREPSPVDDRERLGRTAGLGDMEVFSAPRQALPRPSSASSFGLSKRLLATPRSVSVIGAETMDMLSLSAVEDLVRVAPGVYTTTRWGIQGSVDVRNVPADTYFRGMKRLNLQGHGRSVLAAMETIEIVRGPPSPIYGMGKIGGYTNMIPKSVRAATGGYLLEPQGFVQTIVGSDAKSEVSFGLGGPMSERQGGYYVFGLVEHSDSNVDHVPIDQSVFQAALTLDDFVGRMRLETGVNLQRSRTAGALVSRLTQSLVDDGEYIRGTPLVDLDANGNGRIGYLEMYAESPIVGDVASDNRALRQHFAWPSDAEGRPLPLDEFTVVPGIPAAMYDYLLAHPEADPTGLLRAAGPGGPTPPSGRLPVGFVLDPRSVAFGTFDSARPGAYERDLEADYAIAYFDLIDDTDPNRTIKNQLFFDSMDQYKLSEQPFSQRQDVYAIEDKLTLTRRLARDRPGLDVEFLASFNLRYTSAEALTAYGDYGSHRQDALDGSGLPGPNATFATALLQPDITADGMPWTDFDDTESWEAGIGVLFDIDIDARTNLIVGGRIDSSRARNVDAAGTIELTRGTAVSPAVFQTEQLRASGRDSSLSWTVSVSHELGRGIRPYVTLAETSLALDGNNNVYANSVIEAGHIGRARLVEAGLKAALFEDKLFFSTSAYEQARADVDAGDATGLLNAHVSATTTRGWEAELRAVPTSKLMLSFYALRQKTRYTPNTGANLIVDARALGFADIVDAAGRVVYPAEAFGYGGRTYLTLPAGMPAYDVKQGNPHTQVGMIAQYELDHGLTLSLSGNYFSEVHAGRLKLVELPEAYVINGGISWNGRTVDIRCEVLNAFDEPYFRARTGDTLGDVLASSMPGRRWQVAFRVRL